MSDSEGKWGILKTLVAIGVAVIKTVNRIKNIGNKRKIRKNLQNTYTKNEATVAINSIIQKSSSTCEVKFDSGGGVEVLNSYHVRSRYDRQEVCEIISRTVQDDGSGERLTKRNSGGMAAEWLYHNIAYDLSTYIPFEKISQRLHNSGESAGIDYTWDRRPEVIIPTTILEIMEFE